MFHFELVTPERVLFREQLEEVTLPTTLGEISVLTDHAPLVAVLVPGVAKLKLAKGTEEVAVSGGFIQIADNNVRVLADSAERAEELNLDAIEKAKARAEATMKETDRRNVESFALAAAALDRELARYKVAIKRRDVRRVPTASEASLPHDQNPA